MKRPPKRAGAGPRELTAEGTVASLLARRGAYLELAARFGTPLYVCEDAILRERAREFLSTFRRAVPGLEAFFPVKTNSQPQVLRTLVDAGLGLEVSSGSELGLALDCGARMVLFNGPAKTKTELALALAHRHVVTVVLDSMTELRRLADLAAGQRSVRAGLRLSVENHGAWRKFGVPMDGLAEFLDEAQRWPGIEIRGLQFHTSWNMGPASQVRCLGRLGDVLATLPSAWRQDLDFLDIGGGFWPPQGKWVPRRPPPEGWAPGAVPPFYLTVPAAPLSIFAARIGAALEAHIRPHCAPVIYAEPGRWVANDAVHVLLSVQDIKDGRLAITDGGTNLVGWDRFENNYFPLVNLGRPGLTERPYLVLGSLCTPDDLWGRSFFGEDLQLGDILLLPHQGAYAYSLRQRFIKPLPPTVFVPVDGPPVLVEEAAP